MLLYGNRIDQSYLGTGLGGSTGDMTEAQERAKQYESSIKYYLKKDPNLTESDIASYWISNYIEKGAGMENAIRIVNPEVEKIREGTDFSLEWQQFVDWEIIGYNFDVDTNMKYISISLVDGNDQIINIGDISGNGIILNCEIRLSDNQTVDTSFNGKIHIPFVKNNGVPQYFTFDFTNGVAQSYFYPMTAGVYVLPCVKKYTCYWCNVGGAMANFKNYKLKCSEPLQIIISEGTKVIV